MKTKLKFLRPPIYFITWSTLLVDIFEAITNFKMQIIHSKIARRTTVAIIYYLGIDWICPG